MLDINLLMLALFIMLSFTTGTVTGFGSTVIALTLGAHFYPLETLLPVILPLNIFLNSYIILRHFRHIRVQLLFKKIIPFMGIGFILGMTVFHFLIKGPMLKPLFGIFVAIISVKELYSRIRTQEQVQGSSNIISALYITVAGIFHGLFASGGPLIVYAVSRMNLNKAQFRSTLPVLWVFFNVMLITSYFMSGSLTMETARFSAILMPVVIAGLFLGEKLHGSVNERVFNIFVFIILLISGISIAVR